MKKILIKIINFYQKHISLWLQTKNINCKFYPTCSEYTKQAIEKYVEAMENKDCNFLGLAISVKTAKAVKRNMIKLF